MPIVIASSKEGFFRCGIPHSKTPTTYPDDHFTPEELARFEQEPRLSVTITRAVPDPPAGENHKEVVDDAEVSDADMAGAAPGNAMVLDDTQAQAGDQGGAGLAESGPAVAQDLLEAARTAVAAGDTIKSGAPDIAALEAILGRDVGAAERDLAWDALRAEAGE